MENTEILKDQQNKIALDLYGQPFESLVPSLQRRVTTWAKELVEERALEEQWNRL